jgi:hypothetical protein
MSNFVYVTDPRVVSSLIEVFYPVGSDRERTWIEWATPTNLTNPKDAQAKRALYRHRRREKDR